MYVNYNDLLLSIITVNLNNKLGLKTTIESVVKQTFSNYEFIVIDGDSTDGSKEVIQAISDKVSYSVSEKDGGIYHAMNKGILKASGEYVLFLNSGDYLIDDQVLESLFNLGNSADIIYGDIVLDDGTNRTIGTFPAKPTFSFFFNNSLPHACSLIKRSLFNELGLYNENNKIVSDWEFFLLAINKLQCSYRYVSIPVTVFNLDGISAKKEHQELIIEEKQKVLQQYFASFLSDYSELDKLKKELPEIQSLLGYRLHTRLTKKYRFFLKK